MKTEITTIRIELGGKSIELTAEEARKLYSELDRLFQKEKEYIPYYPYPTLPTYPGPIVIEPSPTIAPPWIPDYWKITCSSEHEPAVLCIGQNES